MANLKLMRAEGIVDRVKCDTGPYFQRRLREALGDHAIVGEISGAGLVGGIQLAEDPSARKRFAHANDVSTRCRDFCFDDGLVMRASHDRMLLSPPLIVTHAEIHEIVEKARVAIDKTARLEDRLTRLACEMLRRHVPERRDGGVVLIRRPCSFPPAPTARRWS